MKLVNAELEFFTARLPGVGNFFFNAFDKSNCRDVPLVFSDKPVSLSSGYCSNEFTMNSLKELCEKVSSWYVDKGVRFGDRVALYMSSSVFYLIHQIALNALGAIAVYANGYLGSKALRCYLRKVDPVGIITDEAHIDLVRGLELDNELEFYSLACDAFCDAIQLPDVYPYEYTSNEPILISHSSGTTGNPKPVIQSHQSFFYGVKKFLEEPSVFDDGVAYSGEPVYLSCLPTAHNSNLAYCMRALLTGRKLVLITSESPIAILDAIEQYSPSIVVAFSSIYQKMLEFNLRDYDLSSISYWVNTGDVAHQRDINQLIKEGHTFQNGGFSSGSSFLDSLGSSEMGSTLFRVRHDKNTNHFPRCIGKKMEWVNAAIFDDNDQELPLGNVGRLGVFSPTITSGYWGNHTLTEQSRIGKYFLTGDLVYADSDGNYYHVDRISDKIHTKKGDVYTLLTEEIALNTFDSVKEAVVVANGESDLSEAVVLVVAKEGLDINEDKILISLNDELSRLALSPVSHVREVNASDIPRGVTGKVLRKKLREQFSLLSYRPISLGSLEPQWGGLISKSSFIAIKHSPFLQKASNGLLSMEEFKSFVAQHYYYARHFVSYLCSVMKNISDSESLQILGENLTEELGLTGDHTIPHEVIYRGTLNKMGINLSDYPESRETKKLVKAMRSYCDSSNSLQGLSALCLGAEAIVSSLYSQLYYAGIKLGFAQEELFYFYLHIECDDGHAESMRAVLENEAKKIPHAKSVMCKVSNDLISKRLNVYSSLVE